MNFVILCVQAGFRNGRGTSDQHPLDHKKSREFQKYTYFCFIDHAKHLTVDHNKLRKTYRDWNTRPPSLPSEKSVTGQEATVRTEHGTSDWFQIRKGVCKGCILLRESIPRQIDKSRGSPRREGSGILKEDERTKFFFAPLHSLGLYNEKNSCLWTVSGKKKKKPSG